MKPDLLEILASPLRPSIESHFWSRTDVRGPDECWPWIAYKSERGYGQFHIRLHPFRAHRVSFVLVFGWQPPVVLHKCDNPSCVNPRHLDGGTHKTNVADRIAKGRSNYRGLDAYREARTAAVKERIALGRRVCPKCGIEKPFEEFWRRAKTADGCETRCRDCSIKAKS